MSIRISEIFGPTIQGEGALIGQPTIFVRTAGCDYRCSWCDTMHAVDSKYRYEWEYMHAEQIFEKIKILSSEKPIMISLSGGNPAIHDFKPLIDIGHGQGYKFALETQGSIARSWFKDLDILTLSPKPPSSEMDTDWQAFDMCLKAAGDNAQIIFKLVIMNDEDYEYARGLSNKYPEFPLYLQACNNGGDSVNIDNIMDKTRWLIDKVMADRWNDVRILPQLHVLLWGDKRGV